MSERASARRQVLELMPKNAVGAEIGVHLGDFSAQILKVACPRTLHLVDPWLYLPQPAYRGSWYGGPRHNQQEMDERYANVSARFGTEIQKGQIVVHRGFASDVANQFGQGELDFLYVDGDHTYKGVSSDIESYWEKLKINSVLIADDYSLDGWWGDGVVRAVHDALNTRKCIVAFALGNQIVLKRIG